MISLSLVARSKSSSSSWVAMTVVLQPGEIVSLDAYQIFIASYMVPQHRLRTTKRCRRGVVTRPYIATYHGVPLAFVSLDSHSLVLPESTIDATPVAF